MRPIAPEVKPSCSRTLSLIATLSTALLTGGLSACSDGAEGDFGPRSSAFEPATPPSSAGPCQTNDTRSCKVVIGEVGGVLSCYVGTQVCRDGEWGACGEEGDLVKVELPIAKPTETPAMQEATPAATTPGDGEP